MKDHRHLERPPASTTARGTQGSHPSTAQQKRADDGPGVRSLEAIRARADDAPRVAQLAAQQGRANSATVQRQSGATGGGAGLPEGLRGGLEQLSGLDLSAVRVHYDSPRPASIQAHAYTQGSDIHVAPGQQRHLAHEGWHAVQQMQGRVRPTLHSQGVAINDAPGLEREADVMGARALQMRPASTPATERSDD